MPLRNFSVLVIWFYQYSVFHLKFSIQLSDCECPSFNNNQASFCWQKPRSCFCVPKLRIFKYQHLWLNCSQYLPSKTHWYQHGHTYLQISCHMQSRQIPEICGFKTTPKTSTRLSYKLQVISGIYSSTQSTQYTHSSYKSQVTSYKLQVTNKDKEIQSLASLFLLLPGAEYLRTSKKLCWRFVYNIFLLLCCIPLDTRVCSPVMLPTGCV